MSTTLDIDQSRAWLTLQQYLFLQRSALAVETIRPGKHRRVETTTFAFAVHFWTLCLLAVYQIFSRSKTYINELSGDGGI